MSRKYDLLFVFQFLEGWQDVGSYKGVVQIIFRLIDDQQAVSLSQEYQE